jgi:hypothetical protein
VRLLLDECIDRRLARDIHGHEISTVSGLEWTGIGNADLLARSAGMFDVFVTVDRNLTFQRPVADLILAVVVLRARTNRLVDLKPLVPGLLRALSTVQPGTVKVVEG